MDGMYAWVEDQRDQSRRDFYTFLREQRGIWTPNDTFKKCCVKWLADGKYHDYGFDEYSFRNGCDGRCNRKHPKIILKYNPEKKLTIATITDLLGPFLNFFSLRISEGTAWPFSEKVYELNGYLRENISDIEARGKFGFHLVSIDRDELDKSDTAQKVERQLLLQEQEEKEPTKKKPRLSLVSKDMVELVGQAMTIVASHLEDFDPFTLYCFRQTCKAFKKIANEVAAVKMQSLQLSVIPYTNGIEHTLLDFDYDSDTCELQECSDESVIKYRKEHIIPFSNNSSTSKYGIGSFQPCENANCKFSWQSSSYYDDYDEENYVGQMIKVYVQQPMKAVLIGKFFLDSCDKEKNYIARRVGLTLEYEIMENEVVYKKSDDDDGGDDDDNSGNDDHTYVSYHGKTEVKSLMVDYSVLVGLYARSLRRSITRKNYEIMKQRPLTDYEKEYSRMVITAANKFVMAD